MQIRRQIKCITLPASEKHQHGITHIGGDWGVNGERVIVRTEDAVKQWEEGVFAYFVKVGSLEVNVISGLHEGRKYLRTLPDNSTEDNLLSLARCE